MSDNVTEQENNLPKGRGYGVFFVNGKVHFNLVGVWADDSFRVETENTAAHQALASRAGYVRQPATL